MDGYFRGQELFGAVREGTEMDAFLSDFLIAPRLNAWNPPLSVRMPFGQFMKE